MPVMRDKAKVMNGRGTVFSYSTGGQAGKYFYRELKEGTKLYRTKLIDGATSLAEAIELAPAIALDMRSEDPHHRSADYIREVEASNTRIADWIERKHPKMNGLKRLLYDNLLKHWDGSKK